MKKIIGMVVMAITCFISTGQASDEVNDRTYFDQQFNALQKSVAEVKGDTTQIVEILGNVFEGTVPAGGTITNLCNANGWNIIVLMGHNNIQNPDVVGAGRTFTYPKTAKEFQIALKVGKPLYNAWLKKQSKTFRVNRIKVDTVEIKRQCTLLAARPVKIIKQEVVVYRDAQKTVVGRGTCKDIPWNATGVWEQFPEGAVGSETQLRPEIDGYKYKLVTRKGDKIYATHCFKDSRHFTLDDLSHKWNVSLTIFSAFGDKGDGGKHKTLIIGINQ